MYMKSLLKIFAVVLFLFAGMATNANAANVDMSGYAWGADSSPFGGVGWINFNNTSTGSKTAGSPSTEYKVEFNQTTWELTGYAWSERYGYIKFGDSNSTFDLDEYPTNKDACEANPKNTSSYGPCNVHIVDDSSGGFKLVGYARFCFVYASGCSGTLKPNSELGGYDGWIAFQQKIGSTFYAVSYNPTDKKFGGYAWGGGSGDISSADYGEGAGWIKMSPTNGGVVCTDGSVDIDCLNSDGPGVTLVADYKKPAYNQSVRLTWTITNNPSNSSCTPDTSSSPANSAWDNYTPSGTSGYLDMGVISETTTFTLSCTYNGKKGSASETVEIDSKYPSITLSVSPTTFSYDQKADLNYSITNIPNGCNAVFKKNGTTFDTDTIENGTPGDPTTIVTGTKNLTGLLGTNVLEVTCTDIAPPSPNRATTETISIGPEPTNIDFSLLEKTTNQTYSSGNFTAGTIPCTNTGLDMKTSIQGVVIGSCKAMIDGSNSNSVWGSNISWSQTEETNYPTTTTKSTGGTSITQEGSTILYQLQCRTLGNVVKNYAIKMTRSCTPASLTLSSSKTCVQPGQDFSILYTGSGIQNNTCKKSGPGIGGSIPGGNPFSVTSSPVYGIPTTSTWSDGQTKTYTINSCVEISNPNGTPLTETISIDVKDDCTGAGTGNCSDNTQNGDETGTDTGGRCGCGSISSNRCPQGGSGPVFKEF